MIDTAHNLLDLGQVINHNQCLFLYAATIIAFLHATFAAADLKYFYTPYNI